MLQIIVDELHIIYTHTYIYVRARARVCVCVYIYIYIYVGNLGCDRQLSTNRAGSHLRSVYVRALRRAH